MLKSTPNMEISVILICMMVLLVFPLQGLLPIVSYSQIPYLSTSNQELPQQRSQTQPSEITQGTNGDGTGSNNNYANNNMVVIITFGDGYKSQYLYAKPILDKYGFKANFFVTCKRVGIDNSQMSWQEIGQLYREGHVIGSKTMNYGINTTKRLDLTHLPTKELEFEVGQSKQCLLGHGINTTIFAVPKNIASDNATVVNTIAKYYDLAINGHSNLMYLHCDGWRQYSNQTDCRTYSDDGSLTFANRYSIREWSMQHIGHGNSYNDSQMFEKFVAELNSQNKFNKGGIINAIPIIGYHNINATIPDVSNTAESSATTLDLFESEMKYLHDNGFRVITFADLGYNENSNSLYIR
ncbi:MAG TPA: polysaccharide deacetylase family protein [Nitrososphaeraceae archaeon]